MRNWQLSMVILMAVTGSATAGPGPILWYPFDDAKALLVDNFGTLGEAYDGAFFGDAHIVEVDGNSACRFDGAGDWVIPGGDENVFDFAGDFAFHARIKVDFLNPDLIGGRGIIWKERSSSEPGHLIAVRNNTGLGQVNIADGDESAGALTTMPIDDDAWHTMIGARQGPAVRLFLDGCLVGVALVPASFDDDIQVTNPHNLVIGGRTISQSDGNPNGFFGNNDDFSGWIDDIQIYDFAAMPDWCEGDLDCDGAVGASDLAILLSQWGGPLSVPDLDLSGTIGSEDLAILLANWGTCR